MAVNGPPGQLQGLPLLINFFDLCERLQASKSAVSTSARLLSEMGLIERLPSPIPRRVYFRFLRGGWVTFMRMYLLPGPAPPDSS